MSNLPNTASVDSTGKETNAPIDNNSGDGGTTFPSLSGGLVANTAISVSNSNLAHVCDITGSMKYSIAWISLQVKQLVESIRQSIQSLWQGNSNSPFGDGASAIVTAIKNMVNQIQKLIQKAKEAQAAVQGYITQLQQLLAYIATIPARIATFLKDCISEATASISSAISNAQAIVNSQSSGALSTATTNSATATINLTTTQNTPAGSSSVATKQIP